MKKIKNVSIMRIENMFTRYAKHEKNRTILNSLLIAIMIIASTAFFSSCQSEEEMNNDIVGTTYIGYIDDGNSTYAAIKFLDNANGYMAIGSASSIDDFTWGWLNGYSGVIQMTFTDGQSALKVLGTENGVLIGYYFENIDDFYRYANQNDTADETLFGGAKVILKAMN